MGQWNASYVQLIGSVRRTPHSIGTLQLECERVEHCHGKYPLLGTAPVRHDALILIGIDTTRLLSAPVVPMLISVDTPDGEKMIFPVASRFITKGGRAEFLVTGPPKIE